jgi:hypothetical protein
LATSYGALRVYCKDCRDGIPYAEQLLNGS